VLECFLIRLDLAGQERREMMIYRKLPELPVRCKVVSDAPDFALCGTQWYHNSLLFFRVSSRLWVTDPLIDPEIPSGDFPRWRAGITASLIRGEGL
jgi:hypothetical protein